MIIQSATVMRTLKIIKSHLVSMTKIAIDWLERNCMQANPEKISGNFPCPWSQKGANRLLH